MRRWSLFTVWVTAPSRTSAKRATARSVFTVTVLPAAAVAGAPVIAGRGRGRAVRVEQVRRGEDLSVGMIGGAGAAQPSAAGEHPAVGQQEGDAVVVPREWPRRPARLNRSVAGSHSSALKTEFSSENGSRAGLPPSTSTLPSGSTTLLWNARA